MNAFSYMVSAHQRPTATLRQCPYCAPQTIVAFGILIKTLFPACLLYISYLYMYNSVIDLAHLNSSGIYCVPKWFMISLKKRNVPVGTSIMQYNIAIAL